MRLIEMFKTKEKGTKAKVCIQIAQVNIYKYVYDRMKCTIVMAKLCIALNGVEWKAK